VREIQLRNAEEFLHLPVQRYSSPTRRRKREEKQMKNENTKKNRRILEETKERKQ
jgi:hypothetical protein